MPSIGQLIAFLDQYYKENWSIGIDDDKEEYAFIQGTGKKEDEMNVFIRGRELIDVLFVAVRNVLEKEEKGERNLC